MESLDFRCTFLQTKVDTMTNILLFGATGAVGKGVLKLAIENKRIDQIIAPTRKALDFSHPKLVNPVIDFSDLSSTADNSAIFTSDIVICALGTTLKKAGSAEAFVNVDRDLVLKLAKRAHELGAKTFILNSSLGARPGNNLYLRTKFEVEQGIEQMGFKRVVHVRPSLIKTVRAEKRLAEEIGLVISSMLGPLIPKKFRPVEALAISRTLLEESLKPAPGVFIIESDEIQS